MPLTEIDINKMSRLICPHVDQVTCIECCKYYLVPSTAPCGHTLCHGCWTGRKQCVTCGAAVNRRSLKLNLQLQKVTEHTKILKEEFEKIFRVNIDELLLHAPVEKELCQDPTKNVQDWLANSDNHFSATEPSQQNSAQDSNNQQKETGSKVQIHNEATKTNSTKNVIHVGIPQDDWDKIEELPDTEDLNTKNKENAIGPMDIEPYAVDPFEFTTDNPRRSSRKKDGKGNVLHNSDVISVDQNSTKISTKGSDSKVSKNSKVSKQNWANVKRMKKEFSKLNKKSKNKLNVSIEMCKKTVFPANKNIPVTAVINSDVNMLNIDDNTPNIGNLKENEEKNEDLEKVILVDVMESESELNGNVKHVNNSENNKLCNTSKTRLFESPTSTNKNQVPPVAFFVKGAFQAPAIKNDNNSCDDNHQTIVVNTDNIEQTANSEDIEITIKIGNTVTNICIKKKEKDIKLKINADREIQTSLEKCTQDNKNIGLCSAAKESEPENNGTINVQNNEHEIQIQKCNTNNNVLSTHKTPLSKKNTESADTATVQYEITESIEKELSKEMEKADIQTTQSKSKISNKTPTSKPVSVNDILDEDCINDLDLFDNDSVKEGNVHSLKSTNHAPSEILISTLKSNRSKKQIDKRIRDTAADDLPISKKLKLTNENNDIGEIDKASKTIQTNNFDQDSELNTYDLVMGKVFANIDLDLAKKSDEKNVENPQFIEMESDNARPKLCDSIHGQSENVFSLLEKENDAPNEILSGKTQTRVENREAPSAKTTDVIEVIDQDLCTPLQGEDNNDHSDESIVEETPQKNASFQKVKQKSSGSLKAENIKNKSLKLKRTELVNARKSSETPNIMSVINLSDTTDDITRKSKHVTVLEAPKCRPTLETPLTINNFVEQIKHKSTPMARKSLNFDNENTEVSELDPEQTLCPSSFIAAKTTQEKEFLCKAFEDSPVTRPKSPLTMRYVRMKSMKYCLAGSCLSPSEISNVKILCSLRKWDYVDKYTKELTHLVVGVDEENKSQRSVKYMCALAASKWIVSYEWVQTCLQMKKVVDEEPFEVLDNAGEPGPRRSRLAKEKLFQGITFFCMPPFSVLDVDTLKGMLEAAGGRVVDEAKAVRVTSESPVALLLAEPEHSTQENRFIYLAMELSIVPVNSEWVLNCLGSYTITSVLELLLCPESLLPPATANWPPDLMARDFD